METKLKKLVLEGFYHEAENVMLTIPLNAQRDIIMNLAYDTESIAIYGFLRYMLEKNKTKYLILKSERHGSNQRHHHWQGGAQPIRHSRIL